MSKQDAVASSPHDARPVALSSPATGHRFGRDFHGTLQKGNVAVQ
jgi:hypothetical protein